MDVSSIGRWHATRGNVAVAFIATWGFASVALMAGCTQQRRSFHPSVDAAALNDISFVHYLATVPVVTVDEGLRAVLQLTDANARSMTYSERSVTLQRRGAIKASWHLEADRILDKGTLGYMLRIICSLPRGLTESLAETTGLGDRRYALKTCIDAGVLPYGVPHAPVTGGELLSALTAAETIIAAKGREKP